jgi:hypothetical protein
MAPKGGKKKPAPMKKASSKKLPMDTPADSWKHIGVQLKHIYNLAANAETFGEFAKFGYTAIKDAAKEDKYLRKATKGKGYNDSRYYQYAKEYEKKMKY